MTITEALAALKEAWPITSFSIDLAVWSHVHGDERSAPAIAWEIYNADAREHHRSATLEGAVQTALHPTTVAETEASLTDAESVS